MSKIFSVNFNRSYNDKYGAVATLGSTATIRNDEKGAALKCNSLATDYITYGDIAAINAIGTGEFSFVVGANVKGFLNHGSVYNCLFSKTTNTPVTGFGCFYQNNDLLFSIVSSVLTVANLSKNKNNLLICTRNSSGVCTAYVDGVQSGATINQPANISTTGLVSIGTDYNTLRTPNASIYLSEVYNHCLSEVEIQKLTADFQAQMPVVKPKRAFIINPVGVSVVLRDDFSNEPADSTTIVPREWEQVSGSYKIVEAIADEGNYGSIKKGTRYLQCVTAGILAIPSKTAYGTWEFDYYKGADNNSSAISIIDSNRIIDDLGGYRIEFNVAEYISLIRSSFIELNKTANSYFSINTWYRIKITRSVAGVFTLYIKGGAFVPTVGQNGWTLVSTTGGIGTNPVTSIALTSTNYLVLDLDPSDRFANLVVKNGIV